MNINFCFYNAYTYCVLVTAIDKLLCFDAKTLILHNMIQNLGNCCWKYASITENTLVTQKTRHFIFGAALDRGSSLMSVISLFLCAKAALSKIA